MLRLFGDRFSGNCHKARLVMAELDIEHEWVDVDVTKKESRTTEFLAKNPAGQIPLLQLDDGQYLPESNAILHYLSHGSPLLPEDRLEHAQVLRWMFFEQYTHEPSLATARYIVRYLGRPAEHEALLQRKIGDSHEALSIIERHLASTPFFVGGRYTIADIALYAYTHVAAEGAIDLSGYPCVLAWIDRIRSRPQHVPMGQ